MGLGDSIGLELACRTMGEKVRAGRWTGGVLFYSCVRAGGEEGDGFPPHGAERRAAKRRR